MPFFEDYGSDFEYYHGAAPVSGNMPGMHLHPHYEVLLILDPVSTDFYINGNVYSIQPPFLALVAPYNLHKSFFPLHTRLERFVFYFGDDMLQRFSGGFELLSEEYRMHTATIFRLSAEQAEKIGGIIKQHDPKVMTPTEQKLVFLLILNTVLGSVNSCETVKFNQQNSYICRVIQYMYEHFNEPLTLDSIAAEFFISRSKLSKDFKAHTNYSLHQFLLELRINKARYLICQGPYDTIREISAAVGFGNGLHFYEAFRKAVGVTPLQYAKQNQSRLKVLDRETKLQNKDRE